MNSTAADLSSDTALAPALLAAVELWKPGPGGPVCVASIPDQADAPTTPMIAEGAALAERAFAQATPRVVTAEGAADVAAMGIAAAVVLPQFVGHGLGSVLILYLRGGKTPTGGPSRGAAELWEGRGGSFELFLGDAYHADLDRFGRISRLVSFPQGAGLPGAVWESGLPGIVPDLPTAKGFLRSAAGLTVGLGLPVIKSAELKAVLLLLCSAVSPMGQAQAIWLADPADADQLICHEATRTPGLPANSTAPPGERLGLQSESPVARAWRRAEPVLETRPDEPAGLRHVLAVPTVVADRVRAVWVILW